MEGEAHRAAARMLLTARRDRREIPGLPGGLKPSSPEKGYRIQEALLDLSPEPLCGFKIGATSAKVQQLIGVDGPFYGRVFETGCVRSPAALTGARFLFRMIEPEFAFRLGAGLAPRAKEYVRDEVAHAVACLYPAIEVINSGLHDWINQGAPSIIADNGAHGALILGKEITEWRSLDLAAQPVSLFVNGTFKGDGTGANCLGHPLNALTWLANMRSRQGKGIESGSVVTTGVVTPFEYIGARDEARADFGELGEVRVAFS